MSIDNAAGIKNPQDNAGEQLSIHFDARDRLCGAYDDATIGQLVRGDVDVV